MAIDIGLSRRLATVLLSGTWSEQGIRKSIRLVLRPKSKSRVMTSLATRIFRQFTPQRLLPTHRQLVEALNADATLWDEVNLYYEFDELPIDIISLPRPQMHPGPGFPNFPVPKLVTPGELADWLSIIPPRLDWLADCHGRERFHRNPKLRHYHYRFLPKRRSGHRLIEEPKPLLKSLQRRILKEILNSIPPHEAAHAFRPGRSVLSYVAPHVAQDCVMHMDLREFFPSIGQAKIRTLFRWVGYPEPVANLLAGLCTNAVPAEILNAETTGLDVNARQQMLRRYTNSHLPQGAPTSPALANLAAYRLDCRLSGLSRKAGCQYTRYADDLVFSGNRSFRKGLSRFRVAVMAIALHEGFQIHHQKTRVMTQGTRQEAAGLVLNHQPNTRREDFDRLRAILCNCIHHGPDSQKSTGETHFKEHLQGQIAYHARIHPGRGIKLQRLFEQIAW
jgi:hypothetical protein